MGKAKRKPRPSMPHWYWLAQDGCWYCKSKNNCNQCKTCRSFAKENFPKKPKVKEMVLTTKIDSPIINIENDNFCFEQKGTKNNEQRIDKEVGSVGGFENG